MDDPGDLYYAEIKMSSRGRGLMGQTIIIGFDDQRDGWSQQLSIAHARSLYEKLGRVLKIAAQAEEVMK